MADAVFLDPAQYSYQSHPAHYNPRSNYKQRILSPVNNRRLAFPPPEVPSPTRTPAPASRSPAPMYGHGQQNQQSLLNGAQSRWSKHVQHQGPYGHQHNASTGTLSSATPHFTPSHLQSAAIISNAARPNTEYWTEQIRAAQASREANQAHHYARNSAGAKQALTTDAKANDDNTDAEAKPVAKTSTDAQVWQAIDFSGQGLRSISSVLFKYHFLEKLYFNNNRLNWLTPQISHLRSLTFLDLSGNQLSSLPAEIGMLSSLRKFHLFDNNLDTLPSEMGYLWRLEFLGIEGNPLNDEYKTVLADGGTKALIRYIREQAEVLDPPNERDWIILDESSAIGQEADRFTVLDANILADAYASGATGGEAYEYVPRAALSWDHRMPLTLHEIKARNADIICLQEVDHTTFTDALRPTLAKDDYKGVYWQKVRAKTLESGLSKRVDGCAIFYNNAKFILLDKQLLEYGPSAIDRPDMKGQHDVYNRLWVRDEIAAIVFLENRETGSRLIVGNTHIHWHPAHTDVKIVQVAMLLERLAHLAQEYTKWPACKNKEAFRYANGDLPDGEAPAVMTPGPSLQYSKAMDIPMILCGDFNSIPGSSAHELLSQGKLSSTIEDLAGRSYGTFTKDGLSHPFNLKSSYANVGEMAYTNYTPSFRGVLDYIWYATNTLQNTALLGEIDTNYLSRIPGFPNWHFPSDHIPLMSEFVVKPRREKRIVEADFGPSAQRDRRS